MCLLLWLRKDVARAPGNSHTVAEYVSQNRDYQ